jgi:hypothetical protein
LNILIPYNPVFKNDLNETFKLTFFPGEVVQEVADREWGVRTTSRQGDQLQVWLFVLITQGSIWLYFIASGIGFKVLSSEN